MKTRLLGLGKQIEPRNRPPPASTRQVQTVQLYRPGHLPFAVVGFYPQGDPGTPPFTVEPMPPEPAPPPAFPQGPPGTPRFTAEPLSRRRTRLHGAGGSLLGECVANCGCAGCNQALLPGLGDAADFTPYDYLPNLGAPARLDAIADLEGIVVYATAAFNLCVSRASGGGCADPPGNLCARPLGSQAIADLWNDAATTYSVAYGNASAGVGSVDDLKLTLISGNIQADAAYAAEGVSPRKVSVTYTPTGGTRTTVQTIDPFGGGWSSTWLWIGGGIVVVGAAALVALTTWEPGR